MRRTLQLRLVFLIGLACSAPLQARMQLVFDSYDVEASTGQELLVQIAAKAPGGSPGYTQWAISYQYSTSLRAGDCQLTSSDVILKTRYQLPKWINEAQAEPLLRARWRIWYSNVLAHEEEHGALAAAAYESVNSQFSRISSESDCAELTTKLAEIVSVTTNEFLNKESELDKLTEYGESGGTSLVNLLDEQDRPPALGAALEANDTSPVEKGLKIFAAFLFLFWLKRRVLG